MKNIFYLILFFFSIQIVSAQYTNIPDSAFEIFLEDNGMGDGIPNNGQVLTANIENVTHLDLPSFAGISDLKGIEDFISVEFLDFSYNTVSNIDLSQNINLSLFGCGFNGLTTLDLTNNTNLTGLYCPANSIINLQLNNPVLDYLECWENQLSSLDLTLCPALDYIDCHINQLVDLNISQCMDLSLLRAWSNQLTSIDLSNNVNLINLDLAHNILTSIDTSHNILLEGFGCSNNSIVNIDLSNNTNLVAVYCSYIPELNSIDIRNGNNENINSFYAFNDNLNCIYVDDSNAEYLNDWLINNTTTFVNNELECESLNNSDLFDISDNIKLFPNPAKDYIAISIKKKAKYRLIENSGKIVCRGHFNVGLNLLSITNLPNGIYILRIELDTNVITRKIIKSE